MRAIEESIEVGDRAFIADGGEPFGAVRAKVGETLVVYVENGGDFTVPLAAVAAVHAQKVILDRDKLDGKLREAIGRAHDAEEPGM
jgi:hypothetical protein